MVAKGSVGSKLRKLLIINSQNSSSKYTNFYGLHDFSPFHCLKGAYHP